MSFSPTLVAGLQVWLDGADPAGNGVVPSNGATISTWVDKSGKGYNATVASGKVAGTYSTAYKAVNFATSSTGYATTYSANPTTETMFVVFNNPSPSGNNNMVIGGQQGARSLGGGFSGNGGTGVVGVLNNEVAWLAATPAGSYTSGTTVLVTCQFTTTSNTIALNGGTFSTGGSPNFYSGTTTYLGVDTTTTTYYYIGYEMEVLFYNSVLSTANQQLIEGYLAWKWGLQTSLPSSHPYRYSFNPLITTYISTPITIPPNAMLIPFNSYSTLKTFILPVVSTNQGRMLIFKDMLGTSGTNPVALSTIGLDRIERSGVSSMSLSQTFGAWTFMNDGRTNWFLTDVYKNTLPIQSNVSFLPGLWAKFYTNTGSIPDSNGPPGNVAGTSGSGWGTALTGTFTSGPTGVNGSNTPGPTNIIHYGNNDGYQPVSSYNYSAVYSGFIYSAVGGTIQFQMQTDDGMRVDFNGANVIIAWQQQGATNYNSSSLTLPAGYTPIVIRWYDTGGGGQSILWHNINGAGYNMDGTGVYYYAPSNITQS